MTPARIGLIFRLLGPVLEIVCIGLLLYGAGRDRSLLGFPLENFLYLGVALGLAMVAIGLGMTPPRLRARPSRRDLDRD